MGAADTQCDALSHGSSKTASSPNWWPELGSQQRLSWPPPKIKALNAANPYVKRGIALTPVKFGISFTTSFFNQAGALIHIYYDGSHPSQSWRHARWGRACSRRWRRWWPKNCRSISTASRFQRPHTGKVPNTSATAASSGSDMNGKAAQAAAATLKEAAVRFRGSAFPGGAVGCRIPLPTAFAPAIRKSPSMRLVKLAYLDRVQLSATGFYKTPKIHYDRATSTGRPFYYFAYGAAVSEVAIDTLTGEYRVTRVDILHDVGRSLNPAVDLGQVEGGFIQGMGWLTTEELWWDESGRLRTHAPSTRKIPHSQRPAAGFSYQAAELRRKYRRDDPPLKGGGRTTAHAGDLGLPGPSPTPSPASRIIATCRPWTHPPHRNEYWTRSTTCGRRSYDWPSRRHRAGGRLAQCRIG